MEPEGSKLFAVIKTGGKQYSVAAGDTITVMTLAGNPGDRVTFDSVLMLSQDGEPALGTPFVDGASVGGQIVEQTRGPKAIAFKKRRRKNSKRKRGHRQDLTLVRITELLMGGAKPSGEDRTAVAT
jgi:large subunit ribosomal protein L21